MVIPKGFPKSVGRVESRLFGFPCFPYSVISMACFGSANPKITVTAKARFREQETSSDAGKGALLHFPYMLAGGKLASHPEQTKIRSMTRASAPIHRRMIVVRPGFQGWPFSNRNRVRTP